MNSALIFLALVVIGAGVWYFLSQKEKSNNNTPAPTPGSTGDSTIPSDGNNGSSGNDGEPGWSK